jgi:hypothetical protein
MVIIARDVHPTEPPDAAPNHPADTLMPEVDGLRVVNAAMARVIAQQAAQLAELRGPDERLALLACDRGGYTAETLRKWCEAGKVDAYQEGCHWFVGTRSL